jgi:hypothetical protein
MLMGFSLGAVVIEVFVNPGKQRADKAVFTPVTGL